MAQPKVLHILFPEKFFSAYIHFVNEHFDSENHLFVYLKTRGDEPQARNVVKMPYYRIPLLFHWHLYRLMKKYDKVLLHSLAKKKVVSFLFLFPRLSKKCYWLLWGGDMYYRLKKHNYAPRKNWSNLVFRKVVSNLGFILTPVKGDVEIAQKAFGFKGEHLDCMLYPSNLFKDGLEEDTHTSTKNILLGSSSHASNNHLEIMERLALLDDEAIRIYCPLSYGDKKNAQSVIAHGKRLFGERFIPLTQFMPLSEYLKLLQTIEFAIFNHWRQQGVGNIISLLGMGKTVYIRKEVTTWSMLQDMEITARSVDTLPHLTPLSTQERQRNQQLVKENFSKERLIEQYRTVFLA